MSITVYGEDNTPFQFPDGTDQEVISRTIRNHYRSADNITTTTQMQNAAWKSAGVPEVHKRSAFERFSDDLMDSASRTTLIADWRSKFIRPELALRNLIPLGVRPMVEDAPKQLKSLNDWGGLLSAGISTSIDRSPVGAFVGTMGALTGLAADKVVPDARTKVKDWERNRRTVFAKASAEDPWYNVDGPMKAVHGLAALTGTLGGAAADPVSYVSGGSSVAARMAVQAAASGAGDIATQGFDMQAGIQDEYDAGQTVAAVATGAAFQGVVEGGGKLLKAGLEKIKAPKLDAPAVDTVTPVAPVEAHFKDALDGSDKINSKPLSFTEQAEAQPISDVYQWHDPYDIKKVDPSVATPAAKIDPLELMGNLPPKLLTRIKKNMADLADVIPHEKAQEFSDWMREGGTPTAKWIDFDKLIEQPEKIEVLQDMLREMFDDAYAPGKKRVHFDDVVERTKKLGISAADAITAHASITGERGLSTSVQTLQVVSDAHFAKMSDVLDKAAAILEDPTATEGAKNDAFTDVTKYTQLATYFDAQLTGTKSEVARALSFMKQQKDRSRTLRELDAYTKEIFGNDLTLEEKVKAVKTMKSAYREKGSDGLRDVVRGIKTRGIMDTIDFWTRASMLATPDVVTNNIVSTALNIEWDLWMESNVRAAMGQVYRLFNPDAVNSYSFRQSLVKNREYRIALARNFTAGLAKLGDLPEVWKDIGRMVNDDQPPGRLDLLNRIGYVASYMPNHMIDGLFRESIRSAEIAGMASDRAFQLSKRYAKSNDRAARVEINAVYKKTLDTIMTEPNAAAVTEAQKFFGTKDLKDARDKYLFGTSEQGDLHMAVMESMNIRNYANDDALRLTFNNKNKLADKVNALIRHNAVTRVVGNISVPFVRTPLNIMNQMTRVMPGITQADALVKVTQKLINHEKVIFEDPDAWHEYIGRQFGSAMILTTVGSLFSAGIITGGAGLGVDKRNTYSIKVGNRWYKYQDFGAVGQALGVMASIYEAATADSNEDGDHLGLITKVGAAGMAAFMSTTLMRGINDFLNHTMSNQTTPEGFAQWATQQVAGRIPGLGTANYVTKLGDPTVKDIYADDFLGMIASAIEAKVPGLSQYLPDKLDLFGRQIERNVAPRSLQSNELGDMEEEFLNLSRVTGDKFKPPARRFNGEKLSAKEYEQVLRVQGQLYRDPDTGLNMEDAVNALINSQDYQTYTWTQRGIAIRKLISDYRSAANAEIKDPDSQFYMEGMVKRTGAERLAKGWSPDETDGSIARKAKRYGLTEADRQILFGDKEAFREHSSDDVYDRFATD